MSAEATRVVDFLGLSQLTETVDAKVGFPLGILYPYSRDLQRVCATYAAAARRWPDAASVLLGDETDTAELAPPSPEQAQAAATYLASIATLYNHIAFAPGGARVTVGSAYRRASIALVPTIGRKRPRRRGRAS